MRHFLLILTILLFASCKTKQQIVEVPVEVPIIKTEYISKVDSIYLRDSIFQMVETKGDTVYFTKNVYKTLYKAHNDTVVKSDTITKPMYITKTVEVEKKLNWFQNVLIYLGILFIIVIIIIIVKWIYGVR